MFLPVYNLAQKGGPGSAYVSLMGRPFDSERDLEVFVFRNKYSGHVMSQKKINILSRNETKRNTAYR